MKLHVVSALWIRFMYIVNIKQYYKYFKDKSKKVFSVYFDC